MPSTGSDDNVSEGHPPSRPSSHDLNCDLPGGEASKQDPSSNSPSLDHGAVSAPIRTKQRISGAQRRKRAREKHASPGDFSTSSNLITPPVKLDPDATSMSEQGQADILHGSHCFDKKLARREASDANESPSAPDLEHLISDPQSIFLVAGTNDSGAESILQTSRDEPESFLTTSAATRVASGTPVNENNDPIDDPKMTTATLEQGRLLSCTVKKSAERLEAHIKARTQLLHCAHDKEAELRVLGEDIKLIHEQLAQNDAVIEELQKQVTMDKDRLKYIYKRLGID